VTTPALAQNVKGKGRHYTHPITGDLVPSVTNVLSMLAKPALVGWAAKEVATLAADLRGSLGSMEHSEVVTLLKGAANRRSTKAAGRGTDVHQYLEYCLRGWEPEPLDETAEQYRYGAEMFLEHEAPELIEAEITMFQPLYAGTADAVVRMGGRVALIDFKTSKGIYPEASLQLAALAACELWHDGTDVIDPTPIDDLIVVRIAPDGYEMGYVSDPAHAMEAFYALWRVWQWSHSDEPYWKEEA
jgi:hypothetical protein